MIRLSKTRAVALALGAVTLMGAAPSLAQPDERSAPAVDAPISVVVRYGDLNLGDPLGARAMLQRIQRAASVACGGDPGLRDLGAMARFEHCRSGAVDHGLVALDSPAVTALARGEAASAKVATR